MLKSRTDTAVPAASGIESRALRRGRPIRPEPAHWGGNRTRRPTCRSRRPLDARHGFGLKNQRLGLEAGERLAQHAFIEGDLVARAGEACNQFLPAQVEDPRQARLLAGGRTFERAPLAQFLIEPVEASTSTARDRP